MRDMLFRSRIFNYLAAATPGLKELVTIGKIWELAQLDRKVEVGRKYDLVIVDAPGHRPRDRLPADAAHLRRRSPGSGRSTRRPRQLDRLHHRPRSTPAPRSSPCPRRCRSTSRRRSSTTCASEVGVAVDRVYMNGLYPERFSDAEAERLEPRPASRRATAPRGRRARRSPSTGARARQRAQLARLRRRVEAPVKTLPFLFEPELGARGGAAPGARGWADGRPSARSSRARRSASAPAPAGSARRRPRRRSRPGWRRAG